MLEYIVFYLNCFILGIEPISIRKAKLIWAFDNNNKVQYPMQI